MYRHANVSAIGSEAAYGSTFALNKTLSDQLEPATLLPVELWTSVDESVRAIALLTGILDSMRVDTRRMFEAARDSWAQASNLVATIVKERGLSFRTGHQIVAIAARRMMEKGQPPTALTTEILDEAAVEHTGRPLGFTQPQVDACVDPRACVEARQSYGGTAPAEVRRQLRVAAARIDSDEASMQELEARLVRAEAETELAVDRLLAGGNV